MGDPYEVNGGDPDDAHASYASPDKGDWEPPKWSRRAAGSIEDPDNPSSIAVLVVDDDPSVRSSVSDILRTVGYTTIEAADGEDALAMLATMRFDVMVLDLKLPRRDGASLLAELPAPPPVVVVTGLELDDESWRRFGSKVVTHLSKPVLPQRLLDAVADAVGSH